MWLEGRPRSRLCALEATSYFHQLDMASQQITPFCNLQSTREAKRRAGKRSITAGSSNSEPQVRPGSCKPASSVKHKARPFEGGKDGCGIADMVHRWLTRSPCSPSVGVEPSRSIKTHTRVHTKQDGITRAMLWTGCSPTKA
jgi:hypothetical protein